MSEPTDHLPRRTLLTGATGFVGRFLLSQLLQESTATIYCLVRAHSKYQAAARIKGSLAGSNLWRPEYVHRTIAIPGDLRQPRLGLSDGDYRELVDKMDSIYHCGASVNHLETYEMAKAANVTATQELLKIAIQGPTRPFHHISTLGIFTDPDRTGTRVVSEDTPIEQERLRQSSGYVASKWVAESIVMKARQEGARCKIFRLGLLWADSRHGRFDELQHVYRLLKSCLLSGSAIEDYRFNQDPVPVDYAARAIVALSDADTGNDEVFHITSAVQACEGLFEQCNQFLDVPLALMPFYDWIQEVKRLHQAGHSLPIVPLLDFAFSMTRHEFEEYLRSRELSHVRAICEKTSRALDKTGTRVPRLDANLISVSLDHMLSRDLELRELPTHRLRVHHQSQIGRRYSCDRSSSL